MQTDNEQTAKTSLAGMKLLFVAMILILVGGALFLFVTIYQRNQEKTASEASIAKTKVPEGEVFYTPPEKLCQGGDIRLPLEGVVTSVHKDRDTVTLLMDTLQGSQQVVVVDICDGRIVTTMTLENKANETATIEYMQPPEEEKPERHIEKTTPPLPAKTGKGTADRQTIRRVLNTITIKDPE